MKESFDVRLVENAKYYTPDPGYKHNFWIDDCQKTKKMGIDPGDISTLME